jgi:hypothetical protein
MRAAPFFPSIITKLDEGGLVWSLITTELTRLVEIVLRDSKVHWKIAEGLLRPIGKSGISCEGRKNRVRPGPSLLRQLPRGSRMSPILCRVLTINESYR